MEIKLKRNSRLVEEVVYDTIEHSIKSPSPGASYKAVGMFEIVDDVFIALYKSSGKTLSLLINTHNFPVDETFSISYHENPLSGIASLQVKHATGQSGISYYTSNMHPVSTMFYSEEMEDVNFGLWLSNVLNLEERKEILISAW